MGGIFLFIYFLFFDKINASQRVFVMGLRNLCLESLQEKR